MKEQNVDTSENEKDDCAQPTEEKRAKKRFRPSKMWNVNVSLEKKCNLANDKHIRAAEILTNRKNTVITRKRSEGAKHAG